MKIIIPGIPYAKARARHARRGNHVITYDIQDAAKKMVKTKLALCFKECQINNPSDCEAIKSSESLVVFITFYLPLPSSDSEINRNLKLWGLQHHTTKPDIDNLAKFYLDCSNGILWPDDKIINHLYLKKVYSKIPATEIFIMPQNENSFSENTKKILSCLSPSELHNLLIDAKKLGSLLDTDINLFDLSESMDQVTTKIADFVTEHGKKITKISKKL